MKSIVATEQELKQLMEKGFFVRSEPVKKGEGSYGIKTNLGSQILSVIKNNKLIYDVGEVFSVKNEKGEEQWFCPKCGFIRKNINACRNIVDLFCFGCLNEEQDETIKPKPLLVRLDKIEEKKTNYINQWLKTFRRVE